MRQKPANRQTTLPARVIAMTRRVLLICATLALVLLGAIEHFPEVHLETTDVYPALICNQGDGALDRSNSGVNHAKPCSMLGSCVAILCADPDVLTSTMTIQAPLSRADAFPGIAPYPPIKPPISHV